jgi:hypothetical protein
MSVLIATSWEKPNLRVDDETARGSRGPSRVCLGPGAPTVPPPEGRAVRLGLPAGQTPPIDVDARPLPWWSLWCTASPEGRTSLRRTCPCQRNRALASGPRNSSGVDGVLRRGFLGTASAWRIQHSDPAAPHKRKNERQGLAHRRHPGQSVTVLEACSQHGRGVAMWSSAGWYASSPRAGIIGIAVLLGAVLVSQDVAGWIVGLVIGLTSVLLAGVLWSSRQL